MTAPQLTIDRVLQTQTEVIITVAGRDFTWPRQDTSMTVEQMLRETALLIQEEERQASAQELIQYRGRPIRDFLPAPPRENERAP